MSHQWDDFSKSLAEDAIPRRQTLRLLGAAIAGAVFSPLATAWAAGPDPCKAFCKCSNKTQQNACLLACRTCNGDTSRLSGSCGTCTCCSTASCNGVCSDLKSNPNCGACGNDCRGETCCGSYCSDLNNDFHNCGGCGVVCDEPGPNAQSACVDGYCDQWCVAGAVACNGVCTLVNSDPNNCGGCGKVCGGSTPYCDRGVCTVNDCEPGFAKCNGECVDVNWDPLNCGACGHVCPYNFGCAFGYCESTGGGAYAY